MKNPSMLMQLVQQLSWKTYCLKLKKAGKLDDPRELNQLLYLRGLQDPYFFYDYFLGHHFDKPLSKMHRAILESDADLLQRGRREVMAAPRANAKTTFHSFVHPIRCICYGTEAFILIISHSSSEANQKVRNILEELETNPRIREVFGELAPIRGQQHLGKGQWGTREFVTQNGVLVMSKSRGKQIRGLLKGTNRPSLIICDDMESPEGVNTPEQRQKTEEFFFKDIMKAGPPDGSLNLKFIGTCLHPEALLPQLLGTHHFERKLYQSIIKYSPRQDLWQAWEQLYTNLTDPDRKKTAQAFYELNEEAMLEGTEVLWPEMESYLALIKMRVDEGVASFNSEKQNEPYDPQKWSFDMKKARKFTWVFENGQRVGLRMLDGSERTVMLHDLSRIVAFHDPALCENPSRKSVSDYAAIAVVGRDRDGYMYVLETFLGKVTAKVQIEECFRLQDKWGFDTIHVETNGSQALMSQLYYDALEKIDGTRQLWVSGVHQTEDKFKRIATLEPDIANGYLCFADDLDPRVFEQLTYFPTSHDDGPDAIHGAVRQLKYVPGTIEVIREPQILL